MMRRKGFGVPPCDGGMEDVNEQELERLVKEEGQLFDKNYADEDGDKTQTLSAVFDSEDKTEEKSGGRDISPVPSNALPTATDFEDAGADEGEQEEVSTEEQETPQEENSSQPPLQNTNSSKRRGGGLYVAVIAICLLVSLALLVLNRREEQSLPIEDTQTQTDAATALPDTAPSSTVTAEQIYSAQKGSSVTVCVYSGDGTQYLSGTVVLDGGCVVTVCANIPQAERVEIVSADGKAYTAEVMGFDSTADVALLRCEGDNLVPISQEDMGTLQAGTRLYAIGTAEDARFGGSLFEGVVSFEERTVEIFGNGDNTRRAVTVGVGGFACDTLRGSPVYDGYGRAVAMVWGSTEGAVGLIVPMTRVLAVAQFFREGETPDRSTLACIAYGAPVLGVIGENYSEEDTVGVIIKDFTSPVCDAALKLRKNDVIVGINEVPATDTQTVKQTVYGFRAGDTVEIHVFRDSQLLSFFVELE